MRLTDFFNFDDFARVVLIGSALMFLVGGIYGVFLHATYASQIDQTRNDLGYISALMKTRSSSSYQRVAGEEARSFREISSRADEISGKIKAPPVTPHAYTYLNYWIASAAFTELALNPAILGLPEETVEAFYSLDNEMVLGERGWWDRDEFYGFDPASGEYRIFLGAKPRLQTVYWSFYIFVFLISFLATFFVVKEEYELPVVPEIIYGIFMPSLFFSVYSLASLLSLLGILRFLDPSQVDVFVLMMSVVITCIISATAAMAAALLKSRVKKAKE